MEFDQEQLDAVLSALGQQLAAVLESAHLVVVGGSGLLGIGAVQRSTQDDRVERRAFGPSLVVDFASRFDQIHLKLYAYASRHEPRDRADLRALTPTRVELEAGARWARSHNAPGPFDDDLRVALAEFGVVDVGRED